MYCSNCGTKIKPELNYCNYCGTKVSKVELETQKTIAENLSSAVGYIGGFGLLGFIFVALILVKNGVHPTALTFISLFYLASLFGICFLIILQIASLTKKELPENEVLQPDFQTGQLNSAATAQLEEHREPASVTENTTRTLDKIKVKI
jgi:zinc-ribbon domain